MTWLTWRQFRAQAMVAAAALAAFAVLFAATGPHPASMYAADGLGSRRLRAASDPEHAARTRHRTNFLSGNGRAFHVSGSGSR